MPSLQALEEFKSSFRSIGGEQQILAAQGLAHDDFPLPDHEPSPLEAGSGASEVDDRALPQDSPGGDDFIDFGDLGDLLGGAGLEGGAGTGEAPLPEFSDTAEESPGASGADMDFGAFLDGIPDDLGLPSGEDNAAEPVEPAGEDQAAAPESPPEAEAAELSEEFPDFDLPDEIPAAALDEDGDSGLPAELLDGFADEIENGRALEDEAAPQEDAAVSEDLGALENEAGIDLGGGEAPAAGFDLGDFPDFSNFEQTPAEPAESIDAFPEDDIPGEDSLLTEDGAVAEADAADALVPGEGEEVLETLEEVSPAEAEDDDMEFPSAGTGDAFDMGGETLDLNTGEMPETGSSESFDNFNLAGDNLAANFNLEGEGGLDDGFGDNFSHLEEFSLSGIDDTFGGRTPGSRPPGQGEQQDLTEAGDVLGEIEEIELSEEDMARIGETLSSYPLNLRVACEELIAEEVVAPDQLSKMLKLLIKGAPPKDAAALAGKILGRTITVPKGFEKKTGEELEAEQSSFAYIFVHNFLPVFRLFMIIAMLVMSVGYLVWQFIYTPLKAEEIYKLGHERIAAGEYSRANERFREAFAIHQKKDWFYTYARSFRDMRAYEFAGEKYQELLNFTASKNKRAIPEKEAVLEYADFATNYRRDYELADRLLRRYILDYNIWDKEALLALGDNNMAWGEIEKARLEDAREAYAKLLER
jgi:hypothetical protein